MTLSPEIKRRMSRLSLSKTLLSADEKILCEKILALSLNGKESIANSLYQISKNRDELYKMARIMTISGGAIEKSGTDTVFGIFEFEDGSRIY